MVQSTDLNGAQVVSQETGLAVVRRPSLLSVFVEAGVASEEQLRVAAAEAMGNGERLGDLVLRRGWVDEERLARLLAQQWGLRFLDQAVLESAVVEREVLSFEEARRVGACPLSVADGERLVALAEPTTDRMNELATLLGPDQAYVVVTETALKRLVRELQVDPQPEPNDDSEQQPLEESAAAGEAEADPLVSELQAATAALTGLAGRAEQLTRLRQAAEQEAETLRGELERVRQQQEQEQELARELQHQLDRERRRTEAVKQQLSTLLAELTA